MKKIAHGRMQHRIEIHSSEHLLNLKQTILTNHKNNLKIGVHIYYISVCLTTDHVTIHTQKTYMIIHKLLIDLP